MMSIRKINEEDITDLMDDLEEIFDNYKYKYDPIMWIY